jgi:DNA helicase-2/ATP-dependent DNA helicase PcrA
LLREYAARIGLHSGFTILDRGDAEDLLALVRHQLGLSATEKRFPTKGTCLAIYSRVINGTAPVGEVLERVFPWCAAWEGELKKVFSSYVEAKQKQNVLDYDDLLLYWSQMLQEPTLRGRSARASITSGRRIPGYQSPAIGDPVGLKPDGRGVTVVGDDAQSIYSFAPRRSATSSTFRSSSRRSRGW